ncbi:MAG: transposase [Rhodospirillaceae bacterium]|nr:MAG: transposase [Rhodospirillaceae bacterium]
MKGYLVKLYPNKSQAILLDKHFGACRWVYNKMIEISQKKYHRTGKSMSGYDMQAMLPKLKKQYPWLAEVNSQSLQIVCHNLADAYGRFFKKQAAYPCFKKKDSHDSFAAINRSYFCGNKLKLQKISAIRFRGGDRPEGAVKKFTVKKIAGSYYASVLIDTGIVPPALQPPERILGIDLGVKDVVVTSAGLHVPAPKYFIFSQKALKIRQRALARCRKGSKNRAKARLRVAKLHQKISNQRKDFNHKLTHQLVANSENQAFAVENLAVKNMLGNHKLAKHIADCGWNQFITFLNYKARDAGKHVIEVDRWFPSTKTCSACGIVRGKISLSERQWKCGSCGSEHDRDRNAATNIALEAGRDFAFDCGGNARPVAILANPVETRKCA